MQHRRQLPLIFIGILVCVALFFSASSCGGRSLLYVDEDYDAQIEEDGTKDFIWPDGDAPMIDVWPDVDTYGGGGTPAGCIVDADCFHMLCCPTPWGVSLCMERCP